MTDDDLQWEQLRRAILATSGIVVPETSRATALKALSELARDARHTPQAYLDSLARGRVAVQNMLDRLELGLTWFMRDEPGIRALVRKTIAFAGTERVPWIWSAGCSTGEEPYSVVMAFLEAGCPANVLATDVNSRAIEVAVSATYPIRKLKQLPEAWQTQFVEWRTDTQFRLSLDVRERVAFMIHNFAETTPPSGQHAKFDAIVCRNALIYFERERAICVMRQLTTAIRVGGSLLLGSVERPAVWDIHDSSLRVSSDGLITPSAAPAPRPVSRHRTRHARRTAGIDRRHQAAERANPARARKPSERGPTPAAHRRDDPPRPQAFPGEHGASARPAGVAPVQPSLREQRDVATIVGDAHRLERSGQPLEALRAIDDALTAETLAAPLHLVRGLLLKHAGRVAEAVDALRSALFLDRKTWLAPYQLGCCLELLGRPGDALDAYRRAVAAVNAGGTSGLPGDLDAVDVLASTVAHACRSRIADLGRGLAS